MEKLSSCEWTKVGVQSTSEPAHTKAVKRVVYHCPIVHNDKDLGGLGKNIIKQHIRRHGLKRTNQKNQRIDAYWHQVKAHLFALSLEYTKTKIYQDCLPVCGKEV